jgi:hypothetical protein
MIRKRQKIADGMYFIMNSEPMLPTGNSANLPRVLPAKQMARHWP